MRSGRDIERLKGNFRKFPYTIPCLALLTAEKCLGGVFNPYF